MKTKYLILGILGVLAIGITFVMAGNYGGEQTGGDDINGPVPANPCNAQNAGKTMCVPPAPPIHPNDRAQVYTCTAGAGGTYSWVLTTTCAKGVGCNDGGTECQMEI